MSNISWRRAAAALAALSLMAAMVSAQSPPAPPATDVEPASAAQSEESSSYSLGLVFGSQLHSSGLAGSISLDAVTRGLKEGLSGKELNPQDRERALQLMRAGREAVAKRNRAAASEFLAKNGVVPDVKTTASGLQYQVFAAGDAQASAPTVNDRVAVHYRGRLLDGTEFDNSDDHAQAATFSLNGVVKGWREALPMMKPGARWRLFVPPELGYDLNSPPAIPPGSLLIFDIELVKVEPRPVTSGQGARQHPADKPAAH